MIIWSNHDGCYVYAVDINTFISNSYVNSNYDLVQCANINISLSQKFFKKFRLLIIICMRTYKTSDIFYSAG